MIDSFRNIYAIPDLRKRVFFTFALLAVYRVGAFIPIPGVDPLALQEFFNAARGTVLGFLNLFSGGALGRMTIFALGIMPYISASIILQLLTVVWPYLEKLSKEGELGRRKITQYTRYGTVVLSVIQSLGISFFLERQSAPGGAPLVPEDIQGWGFRLLTVLTLTTGTAFVMWLGEQISERGIGNGISLIIFAGIVVGLPSAILNTLTSVKTGSMSILTVALLVVFMVLVVAAIVYMERAPAPDPDPVRQARGRSPGVRRPEHLPAAAPQHRRRDPGDLRGLHPVLPADPRPDVREPLAAAHHRGARLGRAALQPGVLQRDHLLLLLLHLDHLQPRGHRREHAQVRRLHPGDPARASAPPSSSTRSSPGSRWSAPSTSRWWRSCRRS